MKRAGIREVKAQLSRFVREAESGERILITDRGRVVAELRAPGAVEQSLSPQELRYRELVARGVIRPAANPDREVFRRSWARWRGLGLPRGTAQALIDAEREE